MRDLALTARQKRGSREAAGRAERQANDELESARRVLEDAKRVHANARRVLAKADGEEQEAEMALRGAVKKLEGWSSRV